MTTQANVASILLEQLSAWGVKNIYGHIGDDVFYLFDAIARQNKINFYLVRHEETAAFMASAHAKLTGEPGVCIADGGPGTLHLLNGLADAFMDRVPVLAITGQVARRDIGTGEKQYLDQQSLFRPIASYTTLLCDPEATTDVMGKAFRCALSSRGVAHVSIPMDVFPLPCHAKIKPFPPYLETCPASPAEVIDNAIRMMEKANRPVILVGEGGRKAGAKLAQLSAAWGAAIINTLPGAGAVDSSVPLYVGGLGHAGSPAATRVLEQADLCLIIGANWWPAKHVPRDIPIIQVSKNPADIGATTPVPYGVVGDTGAVVEYILANMRTSPNQEWVKNVSLAISQWISQLEAEAGVQGTPVHPAAVIRAIQQVIPKDAIICLDTGDHTLWFGRLFRPARQRVLVSGKWRSMGFGLPAALACKIAMPGSKVMALVGDGGLAMNMADFLTAVKYNIDITVVVMNNGTLAMEKNKMLAGGLVPEGTSLHNPDFAGFAECCGGRGYRIQQTDELKDKLREALNNGLPSIVDVIVSDTAVPGTTMPQ